MIAYFIKRLALMIPTLFAIMAINFLIIQLAPGGPIEQIVAKMRGHNVATANNFSTTGQGDTSSSTGNKALPSSGSSQSTYVGAQGLDPDYIKELEVQFGFDKPLPARFFKMMSDYIQFDFGESYFKDQKVTSLIASKLPISISLGLWTTLLVYVISIPLGIKKAVQDGQAFDIWTSSVVIVAYAIPSFLIAIVLVIFFAGGQYWDIFPMRGLFSSDYATLSLGEKILDYFWHMTLPIIAMTLGGFATLTMLTKNCFMAEIHKQYVLTARAKGLSENRVLYGHIFRNAMLLVIAGFPSAFISILFTSSLLIEVIFSLNGLGLLGFEAALSRDYPVMFATVYIFTLLGLVLNIVGDMLYVAIDPRINFERKSE